MMSVVYANAMSFRNVCATMRKTSSTTRNKRYFCAKIKHVRVFNNVENTGIVKPVVTIGSFDGVHLGHRQVIRQLAEYAQKTGGTSVVITLWPHPASVLNPDKKLSLLSTLDEKRQLLESTGIDCLIVLPFTKSFSQTAYSDFVSNYLVKGLCIDTLLVGYDNKIGKNGLGHFAEMEQLAHKLNFNIQKLNILSSNTEPISSTTIRSLLSKGKVREAADLLGRNYNIKGKVVHGNHIGTSLGFPTANLEPEACKVVPENGVYAISATVEGRKHLGMLNIGVRPTINAEKKVTIETHLFEYSGNLYGTSLNVEFLQKIREEQHFESLNNLQRQLEADKLLIKGLFDK